MSTTQTNEAPMPLLLVEDEPLIGTMMKETLAKLGYVVIGPIASLERALVTATEGQFDAAILDVNLSGLPIYLVADMLVTRGIPFVFVTGYGGDALNERYSGRPILEKPILAEALRDIFALQRSNHELLDAVAVSAKTSNTELTPPLPSSA